MRATHLAVFAALAFEVLAPARAAAYATFEITVVDDPGEGFNDMTPVEPVGGNEGTTRGEQRLNALRRAMEIWGAVLDSDVVIRVQASFNPIVCVGGVSTTLAFGGTTFIDYLPAEGGGELLYPTALADRIVGDDLHPGEPDIAIEFNSNVDSGTCLDGTHWYYGLDGDYGLDADMIDTALHELGHGLGMQPMYTTANGEAIGETPSSFMTQVLDLDTGKRWDEMTAAERLASQVNAWRVVWDGPHTKLATEALLGAGRPSVSSPEVPTLSGFAADASHGAWTVATTVSGVLAADTSGACPPADVDGKIALLPWECAHSGWSALVEEDGAIGALVESPNDWELPASPLEEWMPEAVGIPVVAISSADFQRFIDAALAGAVTVEMSIDEDLTLGADEGRVMLNVTSPLTTSSLAHFDPLARPNLLMEPVNGPREPHDLDIMPAFMRDLGWEPFCGNGELDQEEVCDDGEDNSDDEPDACRTSCKEPSCGDGVADTGEACDDGEDNSDNEPDACRTSCEAPSCGDGVVDTGEACDDGEDNSDDERDACRTSCKEPSCGDGVVDTGESCDKGADNSDDEPDACRTSCEAASCGDGVVDTGEACDPGAGAGCESDCSSEVDEGGPDAGGPDAGGPGAGAGGSGTDGGDGASGGDDGGCGCRVVGVRPPSGRPAAGLFAALALGALVLRRRARARG